MTCSRCGAGLVEDRFMDWTARWRCLKCGHVEDAMSRLSFPARQEQGRAKETAEPDYWDEEVHLGSESFVGLNVSDRYQNDQKMQPQEVPTPGAKGTRGIAAIHKPAVQRCGGSR